MPTPMTYEKMIRNRARLFNANKINNTFEPFIGKTYFCEWQKKILFVAYDEWSYRTEENPHPTTRRPSTLMRSKDKDVSHLFRSCPYYKHIDKVLKGINCGLTVEDVAFYNFLIHPIIWKNYKKYGIINKNSIIQDSVKAFELVIDFCNPDLVIFCSMEDYSQVNKALNSTLNGFLRERGIEYLESGNLNYDTNILPEHDTPTKNIRHDIRSFSIVQDFDNAISGDYDEHYNADTCDYDYKLLDLQQVKLKNEQKYPNIPHELQKLASFIDSELKSSGSFIRHRMLQLLKELEHNVQQNFLDIMNKLNDDIFGFPSKSSLGTPIPGLFDALHLLKAITIEYEKAIIDPTVQKRKLCCSFSSETKRKFLFDKQAKELAKKKQDILKDSNKYALNENSQNKKSEKTKKRWEYMGNLNQIRKNIIKNEQKFDSLLLEYINNPYALSHDEFKFLKENSPKYTKLSLEKLEEKIEKQIYGDDENDKQVQIYFESCCNEIINMIRSDRKISLEALAKANHIDEYYLSKLLKKWNIKNINGRWRGSMLKKVHD